jgi:hypothetical protein
MPSLLIGPSQRHNWAKSSSSPMQLTVLRLLPLFLDRIMCVAFRAGCGYDFFAKPSCKLDVVMRDALLQLQ